MKKHITGFLACVALIASATAAAPPSPAQGCDRECLRSHITQILWALVRHDVSKLPVADTLRVTEDADEKKLKDVALVRSVTALRGYRQDFIDERHGQGIGRLLLQELLGTAPLPSVDLAIAVGVGVVGWLAARITGRYRRTRPRAEGS